MDPPHLRRLFDSDRSMLTTDTLDWPTFEALSPREKAGHLTDADGNIQCLIYSQQYTRELLDNLCSIADLIRDSHEDESFSNYVKGLLASRSATLYFTQPSTRTYVSFALAARKLGMMCDEIRDPEMSSLYKGESETDTLLTLAYLADAVIMRQGDHSMIDRFAFALKARGLQTRVINGGSGSEQHPTQALLELYTLHAKLGIGRADRPLRIGIVGDLQRSRTARSLSYLLALYPQVEHVFIAPDELQMGADLTDYLTETKIGWETSGDLPSVLPGLDAVYMMRMQDEYGTTSEGLRQEYNRFRLTPDLVSTMKPDACILHPLPRRNELPVEIDVDPRAHYWEAVNRGKYVRIALLLHMFGKDNFERLKARDYRSLSN